MISREEKIWSWYAKTWFPCHRNFLIRLIEKETPTQVLFRKFFAIFKNTFFTEHLQWRLLFLKKLPFSVLIFSDENNIAKLAIYMSVNCSNRLWYSLKTCNSFFKSLQYRCLPVNFTKFLRASFLQKTSEQLLLDFFIHFTVLHPVN